ncbi:hypothetical protein [sulfur-oxidizing endosymbiont of Gigantopelta aegis]|uniref:hypothetical protein n=1 Tax=sulfur-oxidizing endosymbiont of Gigantopelta aegis TaxID=2794934 RepID=UPI0018DC6846|nr:hypothetical protein [sulfur-oxidizing endosymbiont of Gigantopelta aegis]
MKMNQKLILLTLFFLAISVNSKATLITFDDRAVFESFVTNFTIDGLDNIHQGNYLSGINRGSYKFTTSVYGCVNNFDCGNNTSQGFNPNYLSTSGSGTFEFDSGINAFGLDFGVYDGSNYGSNLLAKITLNAQSRNTKAIIGDGTSNFLG